MKVKKNVLAVAVVICLGLVGIRAAVFFIDGNNETSRKIEATALERFENPGKDATLADIEALKAEIEALKRGKQHLEQDSTDIQNELTSLRSKLVRLNQDQIMNSAHIDPIAETGHEGSENNAEDKETAVLELAPEEEVELADYQMQAQVDLFEETIFTEGTDPEWSKDAELALDMAYQSEEMRGVEAVDAECRTTVCRVQLFLDGSTPSEETFRNLVDLTPWEGQGFVRIDEGDSSQVVVYLARDGHSLPQYKE
jgi:FtsZ-binding cell division protein ZapB